MEYFAPKSTCNLCNKEYTQRGLTKHIKSCINKKLHNTKGRKYIYIVVQSSFNHDYFFHLLLAPTTTLSDLDAFLRNHWLECCGHLSAFTFERWGKEIPMSRKVNKILLPGKTLEYQYDFGSTTELEIKCIAEVAVSIKERKKIMILSRNTQPVIPCDECGKYPATRICTACQWEGEGWLCEKCASGHDCGEDMYFLPVVNSPRTGVCAYDGE